jgi:molybdate transport system permease protein
MTEMYLAPLWISMQTVAVATVITFFLGIAAARWMARYEGKFKNLIDGLFILPLILPPTVVGFGLLLLFGKHGPIGALMSSADISIIFSWPATVITAVIMAFPLMYMSARGAFEQVDRDIENAARTLGAGEWRVFWSITLPLAWSGVAAGTILALARSLGEFGATLMLAGNIPGKTATIPVAIYFSIEGGDFNQALVLIVITLVIAFACIGAMAYFKRKIARAKYNYVLR